jgi:hypothetical protein
MTGFARPDADRPGIVEHFRRLMDLLGVAAIVEKQHTLVQPFRVESF